MCCDDETGQDLTKILQDIYYTFLSRSCQDPARSCHHLGKITKDLAKILVIGHIRTCHDLAIEVTRDLSSILPRFCKIFARICYDLAKIWLNIGKIIYDLVKIIQDHKEPHMYELIET